MDTLPVNITCDLHLQSSITVSALSFSTFVILCVLLMLHLKGDDYRFCFTNVGNSIVLFLGILIGVIATLSVPGDDEHIYGFYKFSIQMVVGIILTIFGCHMFFEAPPNENAKPLGYHHSNISFLIWVITIPLVLIELLKAVAALTVSLDKYLAMASLVAMVQKLVQANIYHFDLRHKIARTDRSVGASFYLKIISLFNFVMWLDSIMTAKEGNKLLERMMHHNSSNNEENNRGLNMIFNANNALLIDYHLLCCLLFAEHAFEIDSPSEEHEHEDDSVDVSDDTFKTLEQFRVSSSQMSGLGFVFGFICIMLQLICGFQYFGLVGAWSNIFPIMADTSVVVLGLTLLKVAGKLQITQITDTWRETNSKGVDVMVAMMGVTGFLFWMILSIFTITWATNIRSLSDEQVNALRWSFAKNFIRSLGIVFQLFFFMKSDPYIGCHKDVRKRRSSYFVLPALMLSLLSVFFMSVIDGNSQAIEMFLENSKINHVLLVLLKAGEPLYLGYCLHLFLHFFIINNNMRAKEVSVRMKNRGTVRSRKNRAVGKACSSSSNHYVSKHTRSISCEKNSMLEPLLNPVDG